LRNLISFWDCVNQRGNEAVFGAHLVQVPSGLVHVVGDLCARHRHGTSVLASPVLYKHEIGEIAFVPGYGRGRIPITSTYLHITGISGSNRIKRQPKHGTPKLYAKYQTFSPEHKISAEVSVRYSRSIITPCSLTSFDWSTAIPFRRVIPLLISSSCTATRNKSAPGKATNVFWSLRVAIDQYNLAPKP